jgi:hypothetical protein
MVQVIERTEGRYDVGELGLGQVRGWRPLGCVVLECDCRARLILDGHAFARFWGLGVPSCGVCGGKFISTPLPSERGRAASGWREAQSPEEEARYSWLEGRLERIEGKEARHEYYARLEGRVAVLR